MEVVIGIAFLLPAGIVQLLSEIALLVQEADTDQWHAEIAGGFEVIAGEQPQAAGENRQALGQAKLSRKIRGLPRLVMAMGVRKPCRLRRHVRRELSHHPFDVSNESGVVGSLTQPLLIDRAKQPDRVVPGRLPEIRIEPAKQLDGLEVPCP